ILRKSWASASISSPKRQFGPSCARPSSEMRYVSHDWRLYWDDMVAADDKVMKYTSGMDVSSFSADERTRDAVLRNLEIIGEASKRIPAEELKRANGLECCLIALAAHISPYRCHPTRPASVRP